MSKVDNGRTHKANRDASKNRANRDILPEKKKKNQSQKAIITDTNKRKLEVHMQIMCINSQ